MSIALFRKKVFFWGVFFIFFMLFGKPIFAYNSQENIRVGLESSFKNAVSVPVGNSSVIVGNVSQGVYYEGGQLNSGSGFVAERDNRNYIKIDKIFSSYSDALNCANDYKAKGLQGIPAYLGQKEWSVYIADASISAVTSASSYNASSVGASAERVVLKSGGQGVVVAGEGVMLQISAEDNQGIVKLGTKQYRGKIEMVGSNAGITAVNELPLELYLYGVIAAEMPASYHEEALKAQAVAARSYAITRIGCHKGSSYELCDTIHCQVYQGVAAETDKTIAAVDATKGEVGYYNGKPIEALFYASSGGYTENSENVWAYQVPYLRAVPEIAEAGDNSWNKTFTLDQMTSLVGAKGDLIGQIKDIVITKIAPGGRILELKIVGSNGEKVLSKDTVRTYFSLPSKLFTINAKGGAVIASQQNLAATNGSAVTQSEKNSVTSAIASKGIVALQQEDLQGEKGERQQVSGIQNTSEKQTSNVTATTNTDIQNVSISTLNGGNFVFQGAGNGHGVGLSQKGAQGMAVKGYSYKDILKYYYQGITVAQ